MPFQLEHDWQSNMSEPKALLGEKTKTKLLLLLCAIWIFAGLTIHAPWKPLEVDSISSIQTVLETGNYIAPTAHKDNRITAPPLYFLTAAFSANLLSDLLSTHDASRLFNSVWLTLALLMVGMTGREVWSKGIGRHATFIMIGTIGLMLSAHSLTHHVAAFTAAATGFYATILMPRRPYRASILFGVALSVALLSSGFLTVSILLFPTVLTILLCQQWRNRKSILFLLIALLMATILSATWLYSFYNDYSALFNTWLTDQLKSITFGYYFYFVRTLIWFGWPALPLGLLGAWYYRQKLWYNPKFKFIIIYFVTTFALLGANANNNEIYTLPLLLPLVALGAGSVEQLRRNHAAALNWFGFTVFTFFGFLIWLGWVGMMTGMPEKIQERMQFLSGADHLIFNPITFTLAILITLVWLTVSMRSKISKRATVTNWAIGMTFIWTLLMCLWLPMIDNAKSYEKPFSRLFKALPDEYNCVHGLGFGDAQKKLLYYHTSIELVEVQQTESLTCEFYLLQDSKGVGKMMPSGEWNLIWQGKRPANRKESFRLYQRLDID